MFGERKPDDKVLEEYKMLNQKILSYEEKIAVIVVLPYWLFLQVA